jgi:hypothetical protein
MRWRPSTTSKSAIFLAISDPVLTVRPESMNPPAESSSGAGAGAIAPNPPASPSTTSTAPDSPAKPTQPAKKSLSREQLKDAGLGGDDEEDDLTETEDEDTGGTAKVKKK